jgi:hypothetical protein
MATALPAFGIDLDLEGPFGKDYSVPFTPPLSPLGWDDLDHEMANSDSLVNQVALPVILEPSVLDPGDFLMRSNPWESITVSFQDQTMSEQEKPPKTRIKRPRDKNLSDRKKKKPKKESASDTRDPLIRKKRTRPPSAADKALKKNKADLIDFTAMRDSTSIRLTSDQNELIKLYVPLLKENENQTKPAIYIIRDLLPLVRHLETFKELTSERLQSLLGKLRIAYEKGDLNISTIKAKEEARVEVNTAILNDFTAIRDSTSIRLTSDQNELIRLYVSLLEKEENKTKPALPIIRLLPPLVGHLETFKDLTSMRARNLLLTYSNV